MGSNLKQTRIMQKERLLNQLAQRKARLMEQGVDSEKLKKDKVLKYLLAELKRTSRAVASIDAREKVIATVKQQKLEKVQQAAAEATEPKKKKEKAAASAKEGKKEKKQKKEKQVAE